MQPPITAFKWHHWQCTHHCLSMISLPGRCNGLFCLSAYWHLEGLVCTLWKTVTFALLSIEVMHSYQQTYKYLNYVYCSLGRQCKIYNFCRRFLCFPIFSKSVEAYFCMYTVQYMLGPFLSNSIQTAGLSTCPPQYQTFLFVFLLYVV